MFPHEWSVKDGYLMPGDAPGLGVDIDEQLAQQFPYAGAYLPISRRRDGTIGPW